MVVKQKQISRTSWSINKTKMRDNYLEPKIKAKNDCAQKELLWSQQNHFRQQQKAENSEKGETTKTRNRKNHGHGTHIRLEESVIAPLEVPLADLERPPGNVSGPLHPKQEILERDIHGHRGSDM